MITIYSYEIDEYLRCRNWTITTQEYLYVSDVKTSPQICCVSYNSYNNNFYMETTDGYNWIFRIKE
jgi:hypothetical protein